MLYRVWVKKAFHYVLKQTQNHRRGYSVLRKAVELCTRAPFLLPRPAVLLGFSVARRAGWVAHHHGG